MANRNYKIDITNPSVLQKSPIQTQDLVDTITKMHVGASYTFTVRTDFTGKIGKTKLKDIAELDPNDSRLGVSKITKLYQQALKIRTTDWDDDYRVKRAKELGWVPEHRENNTTVPDAQRDPIRGANAKTAKHFRIAALDPQTNQPMLNKDGSVKEPLVVLYPGQISLIEPPGVVYYIEYTDGSITGPLKQSDLQGMNIIQPSAFNPEKHEPRVAKDANKRPIIDPDTGKEIVFPVVFTIKETSILSIEGGVIDVQ